MNNGEVRIGIIGSGFMARTYAETTSRYNQRARLVTVAGGRRAPGLAADYGVACEPSVEQLVARPDVDAVIITTPGVAHLEATHLAAAAGKHVLVEKPMASNVAQCQEMIDACRKAGVTLMAIQSQRFRSANRRAKQLIEEGRIGKVWQVHVSSHIIAEWTLGVATSRPWYRDPASDSLFLGQCVHNFDMLRWLAGSEPRRVFGWVGSYGTHGIPDLTAIAQVEFRNGVIGQLWVCIEMPGVSFPNSMFSSRVVGEKGVLDFDGYSHLDLGVDGAWQRVYEQPAFDPLNPLDPVRLQSFIAQNQAFIDCILEHRPPPVSGEDGLAAVELCQACLRSARTGQVVELPS